MTVVSKPPAYDPFDSYSILKPAEEDWFIPRPSRRPFVIAAAFGLMLIGCVYAFSNVRDWIDLSKIDYAEGSMAVKESGPAKTVEKPRALNNSANNLGVSERRSVRRVKPSATPVRNPIPAPRTSRAKSR